MDYHQLINVAGDYDPRPLDVWGAAVVMLCLCFGGYLWHEAKLGSSTYYDDLIHGWDSWNKKHADTDCPTITETDYPFVKIFDQRIRPPALRRLLISMLNPDPEKRATVATVAKNRWLKREVPCCQAGSYEESTTVFDAATLSACCSKRQTIPIHNHMPPKVHHGHKFVGDLGSTVM